MPPSRFLAHGGELPASNFRKCSQLATLAACVVPLAAASATAPVQSKCLAPMVGTKGGTETLESACLFLIYPKSWLLFFFSKSQRQIHMAPFLLPAANGSSSTSANATLPRPAPCLPVNQNQWGPDSISTIVFGLIMVFISIFAIYQTRKQRPLRPAGELGHEWQVDLISS